MFPRSLPTGIALAASLVAAPGPVRAQAQSPAGGHRPRTPLPTVLDCNANGVRDTIDVAQGNSPDCNKNGVPDECDVGTQILIRESFEQGLPAGWSATSGWHVTDACPRASSCDGARWAYFGSDDSCQFFDFVAQGFLTAPEVTIPAGAPSVVLRYCSAYEGEGEEPYDAADVLVNGVLVDHVSPLAQLDWEVRTVDLTSWAGQTVTLSFRFNPMDHFANEFLGWQVDNVLLSARGLGGVGLDCNLDGVPDDCQPDCNANGVPDDCDLTSGTSSDCDLDGVPDECNVVSGASPDCNLNGVPDECDLSTSLAQALANLETSSARMTSFFPDTFSFTEGETGTCIQDGGLGMFSCGSRLNTNLASLVPYTGSRRVASPAFGPDSQYFTAKYDGLFVMAAVDCAIDLLRIDGLNGAGGLGTVDGFDLAVQVDGQPYRVYLKRVYDTQHPSVNQLIIVPGDGTGVSHGFSSNTVFCEQTVQSPAGFERVFYVLVSRHDGALGLPLRPVDAQEIARELIASFPAPFSTDGDDDGVPDECP